MKSRIMIIENNETTLAMLKRMFSDNYDIFQKSPLNLKESDFATFMPELVLFGVDRDIQPALDLLKSAPGVKGLDGVPVIVMMAPDFPEKEQLLFESGAADVILKPLFKEKLIARVDSMCDLLSLKNDMSAQVMIKSREMTKFSMQSMLVIADAIDKKAMYEHKHAMTSKRPFWNELSKEEVVEEIRKGRGTQFDPAAADMLLSLIEEGEILTGGSSSINERTENDLFEEKQENYVTDDLTGFVCAQYVTSKYEKRRFDRHNRSSVILIEIDGFDQILKRYGHAAGDDAIRCLAQIIRANTGSDSTVSRLAGGKFMILTSESKNRQEICNELENMAQAFYNEKSVPQIANARFSVGIATATYVGAGFETLFANADKALYYSKHNEKKLYHFFDENNKPADSSHRVTSSDMEKLKKSAFEKNSMLILFSVFDPDDRVLDVSLQRLSMEKLFDSVSKAVRDIGEARRYSSSQVLAVMPEATESAAYLLAEKVRKNFMSFAGGKSVILSYDIGEAVSAGVKS